jgi:hypothetical protein
MEDFCAALVMYPFVCSQLSLQAKNVDPCVDINFDHNAALYDRKQDGLPVSKQDIPEGNAPVNDPLPTMGMQGVQDVRPLEGMPPAQQYAAPPAQQYAAPPAQQFAAPPAPLAQGLQVGVA